MASNAARRSLRPAGGEEKRANIIQPPVNAPRKHAIAARLDPFFHRLPIVLCLMTAILAGSLWAWRHYRPAMLAEYWRGRVNNGTDAELPGCLHALSELDLAGAAVLVDLLDSDRGAVAAGARATITESMRGWELRSADESSRHFAALAHLLAERVERFSPDARAVAVDLALQMIRRGAVPPAATALLADCQRVLRQSPGAAPGLSNRAASPIAGGHRSIDQLARLPGGGLPMPPPEIETNAGNAGGKNSLAENSGNAAKGIPRRLDPSLDARPFTAKDRENELAASPRIDVGPPNLNVAAAIPVANFNWSELGTLPTRELIRGLQSDDRSMLAHVQSELSRRGFDGTELALARRLADRDASRRRQLAEVLPTLPGVDAKPWLLWLSQDESADVRLAAATIMATSNDEEMLAAIRELATTDNDPRIRTQIQRLVRR